MDRGDRIYVKRHFRRWFNVARVLEDVQEKRGTMRVLDVGCGSGFFTLMFGGEVLGLDNLENVEVYRRRGLQAYSIDLEKDRFPFEDESFDATVCLEVLEHLRDPRNILREMLRVLKLNGYLLISTPNNSMPTWRIRDFLLRFGVVGRIYMGRDLTSDLKRYGEKELRDILFSHGFEVLRTRHSKILLLDDDLVILARKANSSKRDTSLRSVDQY